LFIAVVVDVLIGTLVFFLASATLNRAADLLDLLITDVIAPGNTDASQTRDPPSSAPSVGNQKEKST
jgi:hypothetical protein